MDRTSIPASANAVARISSARRGHRAGDRRHSSRRPPRRQQEPPHCAWPRRPTADTNCLGKPFVQHFQCKGQGASTSIARTIIHRADRYRHAVAVGTRQAERFRQLGSFSLGFGLGRIPSIKPNKSVTSDVTDCSPLTAVAETQAAELRPQAPIGTLGRRLAPQARWRWPRPWSANCVSDSVQAQCGRDGTQLLSSAY